VRDGSEGVLATALLVASVAVAELVLTLRLFRSGLAFGFDANVILVIGILFAIFLWLMQMALRRRVELCRTGAGIPLALFAVGIVLSLITSTHKRPSFVVGANWLAYLGLFVYASNIFRGNRLWTVLLRALLASAVVISLYGLYQRFFGLQEVRSLFDKDPAAVMRRFHLTPDAIDDFRARLHNQRVFSTFVLPNSFAAFLILVFPVQLGWLLDLWGTGSRRSRLCFAVNAACLMAIAAGLFLTKSKGAWIAFAVGLAGWGIVEWRRVLWARRQAVVGVLALVGALLCVAQTAGELPKPSDFIGSFAIRLDYWRGAWRIIEESPVFGVGLDCFGDNYARFKRPEDGESQKVHNDYLQVWAETGLLGVVGLCSFCLVFLHKYAIRFWPSAAPRVREPGQEDPAFIFICLLMGIVAFALQYAAFGTFVPSNSVLPRWWLTGTFCLIWIASYLLNSLALAEIGSCVRLRQGMIVGVVSVMVHSLGDFDLYVHGVAQTLWTLCGIICALSLARSRRVWTWRLGPLGQVGMTVMCVASMGVAVSWIAPRFLKASLHQAFADKYENMGETTRAVEEWRKAIELDPWDVNSHVRLALLYRGMWRKGVLTFRGRSVLDLAIAEAEAAARINPRSAAHHALLGQLLRDKSRFDRSVVNRMVSEHRRAVNLYPTKPDYWARLGGAYEMAGLRREAAGAYERALALSSVQRYPRNELSPSIRAALKARIRFLQGVGREQPKSGKL